MQPAMEGATVGWPYLMGVGGDWAKEADDGLALAGHDALVVSRCSRMG